MRGIGLLASVAAAAMALYGLCSHPSSSALWSSALALAVTGSLLIICGSRRSS